MSDEQSLLHPAHDSSDLLDEKILSGMDENERSTGLRLINNNLKLS
jgi:hypothetical protein